MTNLAEAAPHARITGAGAFVKQAALFALTLAVGVALVILIGMIRRDQLASEINWRRTQTASSSYVQLVRDYLAGSLRGDPAGIIDSPALKRSLWRQVGTAGRQSLELLAISLLFALPLGLLWGALMAWQHETRLGALLNGANIVALAVPSFVVLLLGIITVVDITRTTGVRLTFVQGYGLDRHLILPVTTLVIRGAAYFAQVVALAQREVAGFEWVRYARAKGLGGFRLWQQHMLPLLALPLLGGLLGTLRVVVGAQLLVEFVYNWGGFSKLLMPINESGALSLRREPIEITAMVLLVIFFVLTDGFGRLALWGVGVQRHERGNRA